MTPGDSRQVTLIIEFDRMSLITENIFWKGDCCPFIAHQLKRAYFQIE
jgi:hypothetical protein